MAIDGLSLSGKGDVMKRTVEFYSEGHKLAGDLYLPDDLPQDQKQPGVVLCGGYAGVKEYQRPVENHEQALLSDS